MSQFSDHDVRDILDSVAAGRISPQQASVLLAERAAAAETSATPTTDADGIDHDGAPDGTEPATADATVPEADEHRDAEATSASAPTPAPPTTELPAPTRAIPNETTEIPAHQEPAVRSTNGPTRLRVRAVGRRVRIVGEPFLATVAVEGPHVMRHEGDVLTVASEGEFQATLDNFTLRTPNLRDLQERFVDLTRELVIKVNPRLEVEIEVTAGSVTIERAPRVSHVRVTAGSAKLRDVTGPLDLLVQGGSATVEGGISLGDSKLRVESGSLQLNLLIGTDARVTNDVQLGRLTWDGEATSTGEKLVGEGIGSATVRIEAMMGAVTVREAL